MQGMSFVSKLTGLFLVSLAVGFTVGCDTRSGSETRLAYTPKKTSETSAAMPVVSQFDCQTAVDCDDGDKGTIDSCVDGTCVHVVRECGPGFTMNSVGECVKLEPTCQLIDDGDPCTVDGCDPETGKAIHTMKVCDDGDASTVDTCNAVTGACETASCLDDDPCTVDYDDAGVCAHTPLCREDEVCVEGVCEFRCEEHADCADDNPCTIDSCADDGTCMHKTRACDDGDDTTVDFCEVQETTYECVHVATSCTGGCDDSDPCTVDTCVAGECAHFAQACGQGTVCVSGQCIPAPCQGTVDCDDGNPCTSESCEYGVCVYSQASCQDGTACDAATGACVELEGPDCPAGCDDGDDATLDVCEAGECIHHQPVDCGPGTQLSPATGECVPAQTAKDGCQDGALACQQFEVSGHLVYALCVGGDWLEVQNCGPIGGSQICTVSAGCMEVAP